VLREFRVQFVDRELGSDAPSKYEILTQLTKCTRLQTLAIETKLASAFECNQLLTCAADAKLPVTEVGFAAY
jgi:hypothetical protein